MRNKLFFTTVGLCFFSCFANIVLANTANIISSSGIVSSLDNINPTKNASSTTSLNVQRQYYTEAREALAAGNMSHYERIKLKLTDYPLLPYLNYQELTRELNNVSFQQVNRFLDQHKDTYLSQLLLKQWLKQLASKQQWHEYRNYYKQSLQKHPNVKKYLTDRNINEETIKKFHF